MRILDTLGRKLIACWVGCGLILVGTLNHKVREAIFLAAVGGISSITCTYILGNAWAAGKSGTSSVKETVTVEHETKDGSP